MVINVSILVASVSVFIAGFYLVSWFITRKRFQRLSVGDTWKKVYHESELTVTFTVLNIVRDVINEPDSVTFYAENSAGKSNTHTVSPARFFEDTIFSDSRISDIHYMGTVRVNKGKRD